MTSTAVDLRPLRTDLMDAREHHGRGSYQAREAFELLLRTAAQAGQPLDALRKHTTNEQERFFANTIPGPDGHVFWDGSPGGFVRNDKRTRSPRRWWWAHKHGAEPGPYEDVVPTCGELNCINPEHCEQGRGLRRQRFTEEQMLNALKVAALRLGHAPTLREWEAGRYRPTINVYRTRFGRWSSALERAGLEAVDGGRAYRYQPASREECIRALKFLRKETGRQPDTKTILRHREQLRAAGLPTSLTTYRRLLGPTWPEVLRAAGLKAA